MKARFALLMAAVALLSGCVAPTQYYWGQYENQVYLMYKAPDKATAEIQVIALEKDIEVARSEDKPLAPGFYAHLGFLYFQLGQLDKARRSFEMEKSTFPESTVLMDRFIGKL